MFLFEYHALILFVEKDARESCGNDYDLIQKYLLYEPHVVPSILYCSPFLSPV